MSDAAFAMPLTEPSRVTSAEVRWKLAGVWSTSGTANSAIRILNPSFHFINAGNEQVGFQVPAALLLATPKSANTTASYPSWVKRGVVYGFLVMVLAFTVAVISLFVTATYVRDFSLALLLTSAIALAVSLHAAKRRAGGRF